MDLIGDLRSLAADDTVEVETREGSAYTVRVVEAVDYVEPDEYGAGHLEVPVEFDADGRNLPVEGEAVGTGRILARREGADALGEPKLTAATADVEPHTGRRFETQETLGRVAAVERAALDGPE